MSKKLKYDPSDFVCNVPIEEKLRRVPEDAEWWVHQWATSDHFEIGRICREAYNKINEQQTEIDFLKKEILAKHEDWKHEGQQAANARAEIGCYKIELELHKAMIQDLENALKNAQTNPLQNKLDVIANRIVFGKAQEK